MSKNNFKVNVHDTLLRILSEENDYINLTRLNNKNFRKTRLLIVTIYMIVNLIELKLFLFIYLTFFIFFSSLACELFVYI